LDGLAVDGEDQVWSTIYGGGEVLRLSPMGDVVGIVRLPMCCDTCAAFGRAVFCYYWQELVSGLREVSAISELRGSVFRMNEERVVNTS
jgi:sugar lactone lactonase YvrE